MQLLIGSSEFGKTQLRLDLQSLEFVIQVYFLVELEGQRQLPFVQSLWAAADDPLRAWECARRHLEQQDPGDFCICAVTQVDRPPGAVRDCPVLEEGVVHEHNRAYWGAQGDHFFCRPQKCFAMRDGEPDDDPIDRIDAGFVLVTGERECTAKANVPVDRVVPLFRDFAERHPSAQLLVEWDVERPEAWLLEALDPHPMSLVAENEAALLTNGVVGFGLAAFRQEAELFVDSHGVVFLWMPTADRRSLLEMFADHDIPRSQPGELAFVSDVAHGHIFEEEETAHLRERLKRVSGWAQLAVQDR